MVKFQIGDIVRGKNDWYYSVTTDESECKVIGVDYINEGISVEVLKTRKGMENFIGEKYVVEMNQMVVIRPAKKNNLDWR